MLNKKPFFNINLYEHIHINKGKQELWIATIIRAWKRSFHCCTISTTWSFLKMKKKK
jgi:hypothetical protein